MNVKSLRLYSFLPFFATVLMIAYAYYEQYVEYLDPCPLCMVQRLVIALIGVFYFLTFLIPPKSIARFITAFIITIISILGALVSARHVWIQNLPADEVPACGPGLNYMLENFPFSDALQEILHGSGECAEVVWRFLGLTMPMWTFISFIGFIIYTILWAKLRQNEHE